ncbi:patatin-like phospholipase family protein [Candidatus Palauibacter sp.]|uniref:patatin-like phospholipase family protein n=1 Tax=Candidatus Palauibacter sp. TaxID=3101350 RepID=UPI003B5B91E9
MTEGPGGDAGGAVEGKLAFALSGGGARAAYQTGVLCHIGERLPRLRIPLLTGVSAGAINVGFLASYRGDFRQATRALRRRWLSLTSEEVLRTNPTSLLKVGVRLGGSLLGGGSGLSPEFRSLVDTAPLRSFIERNLVMGAIGERIGAGFIEAIGLTAMSYQTGRAVLFVQGESLSRPGPSSSHYRLVRTDISVDHILASASIPLLFPAVKLGQQYYGDGSFRTAAPLAPAIHLGADRIFTISARYRRSALEARQPDTTRYPPPARVLGLLLNSVFLDTLDWDAAALRRINHLVDNLPPEVTERQGLRHVDLLILRPSRDIGRLAREFEIELPRALRFLVRGLGTQGIRNADFLSYLLFESEYIRALVELGEADAETNWDRIEAFLT